MKRPKYHIVWFVTFRNKFYPGVRKTLCQRILLGTDPAWIHAPSLCPGIDQRYTATPVGIPWALLCRWPHPLAGVGSCW